MFKRWRKTISHVETTEGSSLKEMQNLSYECEYGVKHCFEAFMREQEVNKKTAVKPLKKPENLII